MWSYDKRLQFPVKIKNPDPQLAKIVISQLGGPDGDLEARFGCERIKRAFKPPRLKSPI